MSDQTQEPAWQALPPPEEAETVWYLSPPLRQETERLDLELEASHGG